MPLKFGNKSKDQDDTPEPKETGGPAEKAKGSASFMRRGAAARSEMERAKRRQKERREAVGSTRRYWMQEGEERKITFLDGGFDEDGILDVPSFYEHTVPYETRYTNIRCVARNESPIDGRTESCPICEAGDEPAYVGIFTIIEWLDEPWEDSEGKKHDYNRRLFPAKIQTMNKLQVKATKLVKRGDAEDGLVGVTFDVSRSGGKVARVGDDFDYCGLSSHDELVESVEKPEHADPVDYDAEPELVWRTAAEILEMGIGGERPRSVGPKKGPRNKGAAENL